MKSNTLGFRPGVSPCGNNKNQCFNDVLVSSKASIIFVAICDWMKNVPGAGKAIDDDAGI